MKLSLVLDELPLASFCSTVILSFFVGLKRQLRFRAAGAFLRFGGFLRVRRREIDQFDL